MIVGRGNELKSEAGPCRACASKQTDRTPGSPENQHSPIGETSRAVAALPATVDAASTLAAIKEIAEKAKAYSEQSQSKNTRLAYDGDWRTFQEWCAQHGAAPFPATASTVAAFLVDTAGQVSVSTQRRRLAAIKAMHRVEGHHLDLSTGQFQEIWKGIRRSHGRAVVKKAPMVTGILRRPKRGAFSPKHRIGQETVMAKEQGLTREAIIARINQIDNRFKNTEPWLHPTLSKLAREREKLVATANEKFGLKLKHEWR